MNIQSTKEILKEVESSHKPSVYVWLFSGGDDSLAVGKICFELLPKIDYAIFCDTGTCIPQTKEFVIETCKQMNIPLLIGTTTKKDDYKEYVLKFGFPGRNLKQHTVMYRMLKDHSLRRCISQIRQKRRNIKIVLLTGARYDESTRRMGTVKKIDARGNNIWVNAIQDWTKSDIHSYFTKNKIERSIVAQTIGRSGECNCGVFGNKEELDEINIISPEFVTEMRELEDKVKANGFCWGWGENPPSNWQQVSNGQMSFNGMKQDWEDQQLFMCSTCMNNTPFKHTKERETQLVEYKTLQKSCEGKEEYVLLIGKMVKALKSPRNFQRKTEVLNNLLEEHIKTNRK
jgi:3'-phosphoadenosine 5'-phosphosulfate sulfotransferase (PAPS reductase)/FAD synthetase